MDVSNLRENKKKQQLLDTELVALKTASKRAAEAAAETTGEFIGNKIAHAVVKSNDNKIVKPKHVREKKY